MAFRPEKLLDVAILEHTSDFMSLENEWQDLYQNSPLVTPFQSWAWLYSWWELYGKGYELRLITVRDRGLLVGLMPLMLERRRKTNWLLFIGTGRTSYLDILVREGWEVQVAEAGAEALRRLPSWHLADLQQMRAEAAAWSIFRQWTGPRARIRQDDCSVIDAKPWDELVMSLSQNHRKIARRSVRRVREDGVCCQTASPADTERAARALVALIREQWQERWQYTDPDLWSSTFESHMVAAARRMTAYGLGSISEFWRDGQVIISNFLLFGNDFVAAYWAGASKEALKRYSFSALYIWDMVNAAQSRDYAYMDVLRGEEPYKLRWKPRKVANHRTMLGRKVATFAPHAAYKALYSTVARYIRSESSPRWAKDVRSKFILLRHKRQWRKARKQVASRQERSQPS